MKALALAASACLLFVARWGEAKTPVGAGTAQAMPSSVSAGALTWTSLSTAHFELFTTGSDDTGRRLLDRFESLREGLDPLLSAPGRRRRPVCVIIFRSREEFEPYAPMRRSTGFFLPGATRDFIVMDEASAKTRAAAHEYGHSVISQNGWSIPTWLSEGLAELYSNAAETYSGEAPALGRFLDSRVLSLRQREWIGLNDLVSARADSPIFTGAASVDSAYAESWLLAHMLVLDERYSSKFTSLISALRTGGASQAFDAVYGKSLAEVERDLGQYIEVGEANARTLDTLRRTQPEPVRVELRADFEARLALAEMLRNYLGRATQAEEAYRELARDYPLRAEAEDGMAALYRGEGNQALAAEHQDLADRLRAITWLSY